MNYLQKMHNKFHQIFERILCQNDLLVSMFVKFYNSILKNEMDLLSDITGHALVVGCGSIPYTVISLLTYTSFTITAIDIDSNALVYAKRIVHKYDGKNRVRFLIADASSIELSDFSLIILSHGVEPKDDVLTHIIHSSPEKQKILYRTNWQLFQLIFGKDVLPYQFKMQKSCFRLDMIKSQLLELVNE